MVPLNPDDEQEAVAPPAGQRESHRLQEEVAELRRRCHTLEQQVAQLAVVLSLTAPPVAVRGLVGFPFAELGVNTRVWK